MGVSRRCRRPVARLSKRIIFEKACCCLAQTHFPLAMSLWNRRTLPQRPSRNLLCLASTFDQVDSVNTPPSYLLATDAVRHLASFREDCRVLLRSGLIRKFLRENNRSPSPISRASLRHVVPSFTVEVRRRPRLATKASQDLQMSDTKTRSAAFESESHRLAAATFGSARTPNNPSGDAASYPKRRILQSLAPEKPPGGQLQDASLSAGASHLTRAQKPTSVGPIEGKDHTSKLSRIWEASSELTAQLADRSSVGSVRSSASPSDGTAVSSDMPTATANYVVGISGGPVPRAKAKRRVQIPIALDASPIPVSAKEPRFHHANGLLGIAPDGRRRRFAPKSKANHHGSLCLRR